MRTESVTKCVVFLLLLCGSSTALGGDKTWNTGSGSWDVDGYWTPWGIPGANDTALISKTGGPTVTFSLDADRSVFMLMVEKSGKLLHTSHKLTVLNNLYLGYGSGTGTYDLNQTRASLEVLHIYIA